jgi:D-alanyl-D-alanine carboxypeptidase (penicillin-binding protein 5/6)
MRSISSVSLPLLLCAALLAPLHQAFAQSIETAARQAIIVDYNTGAVLLEKNADELMTPSSMSKLMTIYLVFSRLKEGSLKMSDSLPVSETAWKRHYKTDESLMFLPVHGTATVDELLRGVIIQSGNDACSVLAEALAGSEEAFAELETRTGKKIGLQNSTFRNASGVPEPGHKMTARDLSVLASRLIADFPDYYPIFAEKSFTYNNIKQDNRNPLIWGEIPGADGLKTGHTEEAGYGEVGSVIRNGRRVILVLNGLPSIKARAEESQRLAEWAFREFEDYPVYKAGEMVGEAPLTDGVAPSVPMQVEKELILTLPRGVHNEIKVAITRSEGLAAPVKKGAPVGQAVISLPGRPEIKVALLAANDVARLDFFGRLRKKLAHLIGG